MSSASPAPDVNGHDDAAANGASSSTSAPAHPHLVKPILYVKELDPSLSDKDLASGPLEHCLPVRLHIDRSAGTETPANGKIEFQTLAKAELALATIRTLKLSISEGEADPKPSAKPRLVKQLPHGLEDVDLYELFRPFGALARAHRILTNPAGQHTGFRGMGLVEYYNEDDAQRAQNEMHCAEHQGKTLSVSIDNVAHRPSTKEFSAAAAPFVPGAGGSRIMNASAPAFQPPQRNVSGSEASAYAPSAGAALNHQQAGPIYAVPGTNLQYSASAATYIDPCNLFCKNLDPDITSSDLFNAFREFGTIVSARVMRDQNNVSREFGFVSFKMADEAARALAARNGYQMGSKTMTVSFHEPKRLREQKLSAKFGTSGPGSAGGSASPVLPSGLRDSPPLSASAASDPRRSPTLESASRTLPATGPYTVSQLSSVPSSAIASELDKRVKSLPGIMANEVDDIVASLAQLELAKVAAALNDGDELEQSVVEVRAAKAGGLQSNGNGASSSSMYAPGGLLSLPVQPSGEKGDAASILSTAPAASKERARLLRAVSSAAPSDAAVEDITDLLASLPKKERAMCLFNAEFLRSKIDEARGILEMSDDEDGEVVGAAKAKMAGGEAAPATTPAAAAAATTGASTTHTLSTLAALPAKSIIDLANAPRDSQSAGLPLPKADPAVVASTDAFIDSLAGKSSNDQKQKVGDGLFKKIRSMGVKGAPKLTIALLDSEDLRSLAHLMNSYPEVLREKVNLLVAAGSK